MAKWIQQRQRLLKTAQPQRGNKKFKQKIKIKTAANGGWWIHHLGRPRESSERTNNISFGTAFSAAAPPVSHILSLSAAASTSPPVLGGRAAGPWPFWQFTLRDVSERVSTRLCGPHKWSIEGNLFSHKSLVSIDSPIPSPIIYPRNAPLLWHVSVGYSAHTHTQLLHP